MQDRYLFRGKRLDNDERVEGDLRQDKDLGTAYISGWDYYQDGSGNQREPYEYEVDPATVGQCTGLKDENGKLIFEGDILHGGTTYYKEYGNSVVKYGCYTDSDVEALKQGSYPDTNEDHCAIQDLSSAHCGWHFDFEGTGEAGIDPEYINTFEIIGNIHDKEQSN